jgi:hypothetical protein
VDVGIDLLPHFDDLALGRDEEGVAAGILGVAVGHEGDAVLVDDLVVGVGQEFEAEGVFGAPGFVAFDGVEADAEDDCVGGVILRHVALEAVGLDGAAGGLVLGVEVEDNPLAFVVGEADGLVFLRGQSEVGRGCADLHGVCRGRCVGFDAGAAGCCYGDDCCDPDCFAHGVFPFGESALCRRV